MESSPGHPAHGQYNDGSYLHQYHVI